MSLATLNGSALVDCELRGDAARQAAEKACTLLQVALDESNVSDLLMIATGALSPISGFLCQAEYKAVVDTMRLPTGEVLGLPITLAVHPHLLEHLRAEHEVGLSYRGTCLGTMKVADIFRRNVRYEARLVYGTEDPAHPGVARLMAHGEWLLGGPVELFRRPYLQFARYHKTPRELREEFSRRGWQTVVGFQTRNPIHRAHEYIQKCALEIVDGLLLHPLVGETKSDDVPGGVRLRSYEVMLERYYPAERVFLAAFPAAMRYAGPREAVFHAICRRNYGCTHFIVGRDHAGVGNYYGTYDAQRIFSEFGPTELGIRPLMFEHTFYCKVCDQMSSAKTCPHGPECHISLSGTKVRAILRAGESPPPQVTRPEVAAVLVAPQEAAATRE